MTSHHVICHVTVVSCASSLSKRKIKEKRKENQYKIRKIKEKRKENQYKIRKIKEKRKENQYKIRKIKEKKNKIVSVQASHNIVHERI